MDSLIVQMKRVSQLNSAKKRIFGNLLHFFLSLPGSELATLRIRNFNQDYFHLKTVHRQREGDFFCLSAGLGPRILCLIKYNLKWSHQKGMVWVNFLFHQSCHLLIHLIRDFPRDISWLTLSKRKRRNRPSWTSCQCKSRQLRRPKTILKPVELGKFVGNVLILFRSSFVQNFFVQNCPIMLVPGWKTD